MQWVRRWATGRTVGGNHDSHLSKLESDPDPLHSPSDLELTHYAQLNPQQLCFIGNLPDLIRNHWRGLHIEMLHGHFTRSNQSVSYLSTPKQLVELHHEGSVDLTLVGHTHYVFVCESNGSCVANSGSVAAPICALRTAQQQIVMIADDDPAAACRSSFLSISEQGGQICVRIELFDYDRRAALSRFKQLDHLAMTLAYREAWLLHGLHDPTFLTTE